MGYSPWSRKELDSTECLRTVNMQWCLVLICISLMTYDVEDFFHMLVSSLVRCLFKGSLIHY